MAETRECAPTLAAESGGMTGGRCFCTFSADGRFRTLFPHCTATWLQLASCGWEHTRAGDYVTRTSLSTFVHREPFQASGRVETDGWVDRRWTEVPLSVGDVSGLRRRPARHGLAYRYEAVGNAGQGCGGCLARRAFLAYGSRGKCPLVPLVYPCVYGFCRLCSWPSAQVRRARAQTAKDDQPSKPCACQALGLRVRADWAPGLIP